MNKALLLSLVLACTFLAGCDILMPNDPWANSWKIASIETDESEEADTVLDVIKFRMNEGYLRLYKEGNYVLFSKYGSTLGKWKQESDKQLTLYKFSSEQDAVFEVLRHDKKWLTLQPVQIGNVKPQQAINLLLKIDPYFEYKKTDLMKVGINAWRIKPRHQESKEEIRRRVAAHINYLIAYFQFTQDNGKGVFETWQLQTPLRFYSNGMSVENLDTDKPQHWRQWFYNEEDAIKGHELITQALRSMNSYPRDTKTFTEGYVLALQEMKEFIERKKLAN